MENMGAKKLKPESRSADKKGRLNLGAKYAQQDFIIKENKNGSILLEPAVTFTIPTREAWLWKNKTAIKAVMTGIDEARNGKLVDDPRQNENEEWLKELDNESDTSE